MAIYMTMGESEKEKTMRWRTYMFLYRLYYHIIPKENLWRVIMKKLIVLPLLFTVAMLSIGELIQTSAGPTSSTCKRSEFVSAYWNCTPAPAIGDHIAVIRQVVDENGTRLARCHEDVSGFGLRRTMETLTSENIVDCPYVIGTKHVYRV